MGGKISMTQFTGRPLHDSSLYHLPLRKVFMSLSKILAHLTFLQYQSIERDGSP